MRDVASLQVFTLWIRSVLRFGDELVRLEDGGGATCSTISVPEVEAVFLVSSALTGRKLVMMTMKVETTVKKLAGIVSIMILIISPVDVE
jgi:hypothetical protein